MKTFPNNYDYYMVDGTTFRPIFAKSAMRAFQTAVLRLRRNHGIEMPNGTYAVSFGPGFMHTVDIDYPAGDDGDDGDDRDGTFGFAEITDAELDACCPRFESDPDADLVRDW